MHSLRLQCLAAIRGRGGRSTLSLSLPLHSITSNYSTSTTNGDGGGDDQWNDAWDTAWLPEDLTAKNRDPWETDVNYLSTTSTTDSPEVDSETKAFFEDMSENWDQRRKTTANVHKQPSLKEESVAGAQNNGSSLYSLDNIKKDYRLKKQRIHASLWMKEIEKQQEANLGDSPPHDIDRLLDSCSAIFDTANKNWDNPEVPSSSEFKSKPDGWETTSKAQDGNIWEMSQREEDILLQEFDRRIACSKFQIASFIKTHIFSRRRPIDGWKYMIEVLGPNARKGKGSVSRMATISDTATQPFKEERTAVANNCKPRNTKYLHQH